jgi:hypothetical protein
MVFVLRLQTTGKSAGNAMITGITVPASSRLHRTVMDKAPREVSAPLLSQDLGAPA